VRFRHLAFVAIAAIAAGRASALSAQAAVTAPPSAREQTAARREARVSALAAPAHEPAPASAQTQAAARELTGEQIYRSACITCHAADGKGSPRSVVGFDAPLPDFTDCAFASGEPDPDWYAVVHEGGPIRGLDRHMPAFGGALSEREMTLAVSHLRTFCEEPSWPRGDLNFPRAFFTEKAFPENEAVWATTFTGGGAKSVANSLIYERRFGVRNQIEVNAPIDLQQDGNRTWTRGLGDVAVAFKRAFYSSMDTGRIAAAGVEVILPTGKESLGLGNGYTVYEPFAMWGQALPRSSFLQMHGGVELPSDTTRGPREVFLRTTAGTTFAQDRGFGRAWSPQVEVLWARPEGGSSEWDVVPQLQVTLSKLQHVMVAGGVRIPVSQRPNRHTQLLVYLLWDWFDGGFFEFWE
jgi:mono/diheme cytochrome c family protein